MSSIFNCEFCEYKTKKKYNLNRHQTTLHPKNVMKQIKEKRKKKKEKKKKEKIEEEIKKEIEEEKNYTCVKCNKKYKTKKYLISHQSKCNGLNILSCPKCMFMFTSRHSKSNHIKKNNCIAKNIININNENKEFIYLLQEREFIKTKEPIYKIGKTKQEKLKRIKSYPNGSELLFYIVCDNSDEIEKTIINKFKGHFIHKKEFGNEYFMGDYNLMIDTIYNIIRTSIKEDIKDNNENIKDNRCSKCNKFYKTNKYLINHQSKCIGLNILSCPKCMNTFSNINNKNKHIKNNNCKPKSIKYNIIITDDYINDYGNERNDYLEDFNNNIKD